MNRWRIMGMMPTGERFLVVMGSSREECLQLFASSLEEYTWADLEKIDSFWLEQWGIFEDRDFPEWMPLEFVPKRPVMIRKGRMEVAAC